MVGTSRNRERTGKRKVTELSRIARLVPNVGQIDIDLTQYCRKCRRPQAFMESKPWEVPDGHWDQCRRHARFYGHNCIALLCIEPQMGPVGTKVYASADDSIRSVVWGGEEHLLYVLNQAKEIHVCW